MTTHKAVTNGAGKFLGRLSMTETTLSWVGPARAACYPTDAAALAVASQFGGTVVNAPVWDAAASAYVVSA